MKNLTTEERKKTLLDGNEVELAIEGRFTNLRIFASIPTNARPLGDKKVRFRLDRANQYSATLSDKTVNYLDKEHKAITKLNELYGFDGATLEDIDNILLIVKDMESRPCVSW